MSSSTYVVPDHGFGAAANLPVHNIEPDTFAELMTKSKDGVAKVNVTVGHHEGDNALAVRMDGHHIGLVPAADAQKYTELQWIMDAGLAPSLTMQLQLDKDDMPVAHIILPPPGLCVPANNPPAVRWAMVEGTTPIVVNSMPLALPNFPQTPLHFLATLKSKRYLGHCSVSVYVEDTYVGSIPREAAHQMSEIVNNYELSSLVSVVRAFYEYNNGRPQLTVYADPQRKSRHSFNIAAGTASATSLVLAAASTARAEAQVPTQGFFTQAGVFAHPSYVMGTAGSSAKLGVVGIAGSAGSTGTAGTVSSAVATTAGVAGTGSAVGTAAVATGGSILGLQSIAAAATAVLAIGGAGYAAHNLSNRVDERVSADSLAMETLVNMNPADAVIPTPPAAPTPAPTAAATTIASALTDDSAAAGAQSTEISGVLPRLDANDTGPLTGGTVTVDGARVSGQAGATNAQSAAAAQNVPAPTATANAAPAPVHGDDSGLISDPFEVITQASAAPKGEAQTDASVAASVVEPVTTGVAEAPDVFDDASVSTTTSAAPATTTETITETTAAPSTTSQATVTSIAPAPMSADPTPTSTTTEDLVTTETITPVLETPTEPAPTTTTAEVIAPAITGMAGSETPTAEVTTEEPAAETTTEAPAAETTTEEPAAETTSEVALEPTPEQSPVETPTETTTDAAIVKPNWLDRAPVEPVPLEPSIVDEAPINQNLCNAGDLISPNDGYPTDATDPVATTDPADSGLTFWDKVFFILFGV